MRTQKEHTAADAQIARSAFSDDRASNEELLRRGIATRHGLIPGRLVEVGAAPAVIYVLQTTPGGPVKVGYSTKAELRGRVAELQTGNPSKLNIIAQAPGYLSHERRAHQALKGDRLVGEWFGWSPRVAAFVKALKSGGIDAAIAAAKMTQDRP